LTWLDRFWNPGCFPAVDIDLSYIRAMRPNSVGLDHANPVFRISAGVVANRSRSLSAVKALFD
jgi:hypothetical protein